MAPMHVSFSRYSTDSRRTSTQAPIFNPRWKTLRSAHDTSLRLAMLSRPRYLVSGAHRHLPAG